MADNAVLVANSDMARQEERDAGNGNITPGHLLEIQADGTVIPHSTAAGVALKLIAGLPFDPDLDKADSIPSGARVRLKYVRPGVRVDALSGAAVTDGAFVVSSGDGRFRDLDTAGGDQRGAAVGQAMESTGGAGERFEMVIR